MAALTQKQIDKFWFDGVLVVEDAVSAKELTDLKQVFEGWIEESRSYSKDYGKTLDMLYCSHPGCQFGNDYMFDGNATIMELDHINRDTSDSRPENLRSLCSLHHSQTLGYKNRKIPISPRAFARYKRR